MNGSTAQGIDQTLKGGVLGIITYLGIKYNADPALLAMSMPLISAVLAFISSKIGDPHIAAFLSPKKDQPKK